MYRFINKALPVSFMLCLFIIVGTFAALAKSDDSAGIHTPEIVVYSPITDSIGHEIYVDVQSLSELVAIDAARMQSFDTNRVTCENALAAHQQQIDTILNLVCENGIDNFQDMSVFLQSLQYDGDYMSIVPYSCSSGNCVFVPVWVTINGARLPGFMCTICTRVVIL